MDRSQATSSNPRATSQEANVRGNVKAEESVTDDAFPCLACDEIFHSVDEREQHRLNEHMHLYAVGECLFCGAKSKKYSNVFKFRDHFREQHATEFGRLTTHALPNRLSEIEIVSAGFIRAEDRLKIAMMRMDTMDPPSDASPLEQFDTNEVNASLNDVRDESFKYLPSHRTSFIQAIPSASDPQPQSAATQGRVTAEQVLASFKSEPDSELEIKTEDDSYAFANLSPMAEGDTVPVDAGVDDGPSTSRGLVPSPPPHPHLHHPDDAQMMPQQGSSRMAQGTPRPPVVASRKRNSKALDGPSAVKKLKKQTIDAAPAAAVKALAAPAASSNEIVGSIEFDFERNKINTKNWTYSEPSVEVAGIQWSIALMRKANQLSIFLARMDGDYEIETVNAAFKITLINHADEKKNVVGQVTQTTFDNAPKRGWGLDYFLEWKTVVDKSKGFIENDKITARVDFAVSNIVGYKRVQPRVAVTHAAVTAPAEPAVAAADTASSSAASPAAGAAPTAASSAGPSSLLRLRRFIRKCDAEPAHAPVAPAGPTDANPTATAAAPAAQAAVPPTAAPTAAPSSLLLLRRFIRNSQS